MEKIRFVTLAGTEASVAQAMIFAESMRRFGGGMGRFPFVLMRPDSVDALSDVEMQQFEGQDIQLFTFNRDEETGNGRTGDAFTIAPVLGLLSNLTLDRIRYKINHQENGMISIS